MAQEKGERFSTVSLDIENCAFEYRMWLLFLNTRLYCSFLLFQKRRMEAVARHEFTATADDELSFPKGVTVKVTISNV